MRSRIAAALEPRFGRNERDDPQPHRMGNRPDQARRAGRRVGRPRRGRSPLLAPSRPKMRSRLRRLGCLFFPLCGFGCGSDLATAHPGRREIVAPGGCHANPDQAPDLLGLCPIDLFCLGGSLSSSKSLRASGWSSISARMGKWMNCSSISRMECSWLGERRLRRFAEARMSQSGT